MKKKVKKKVKSDRMSPVGESWESYEKKHFSENEIVEADLMVQVVGEIIKARQEKNISQRDLEMISGVRQSVIARMEKGITDPQLSTIVKVLASLGKKLTIAPINKDC